VPWSANVRRHFSFNLTLSEFETGTRKLVQTNKANLVFKFYHQSTLKALMPREASYILQPYCQHSAIWTQFCPSGTIYSPVQRILDRHWYDTLTNPLPKLTRKPVFEKPWESEQAIRCPTAFREGFAVYSARCTSWKQISMKFALGQMEWPA
jgi:hypothetical protein